MKKIRPGLLLISVFLSWKNYPVKIKVSIYNQQHSFCLKVAALHFQLLADLHSYPPSMRTACQLWICSSWKWIIWVLTVAIHFLVFPSYFEVEQTETQVKSIILYHILLYSGTVVTSFTPENSLYDFISAFTLSLSENATLP